ncbi:MAG: hypothetical protein R3B09_13170 [Nannocystaceae bacterium]
MRLRLHIDRLVLPEGAVDDPRGLPAAIEAALLDMVDGTCPQDLLAADLRSGGARPGPRPIVADPGPLPQAIAAAVLSTLRGAR